MIECRHVSFRHESAEKNNLTNIDLHIKQGECVLLTGKSGCGKTTLTRLLNGLIPHFYEGEQQGKVLVNHLDVSQAPSWDIAQMVGSVFQDPRSQFFTTNTTAEVAFGCENLGHTTASIQADTANAFAKLQITSLENQPIFHLSSGEKQKIALASIYAMNPAIYVLDEPSANLDIRSTNELALLLKEAKDRGVTIVIAEHRLYYLMDLVDRIIYIEDGQIKANWLPAQALSLPQKELAAKGLRAFSIDKIRLPAAAHESKSVNQYKVDHLTLAFGKKTILTDISFEVAADSPNMIGIIGANGVGKTTLGRALSGLKKIADGLITLDGKALSLKERANHSFFVMQDTDYQLFTDSVINELELGHEADAEYLSEADQILTEMDLLAYKEQHPMALSGGQKQRVTIASAVLSKAKILLLDEPSSGLDGQSMYRVSQLLKRIAQKGQIIFIISHDYEFLLQTVQRVLYIKDQRLADDFLLTKETREKLANYCFANE